MNESREEKFVLIIDDDEDYRDLITLYLQLEGYQAKAVANGVDALGMIGDPMPSLIITEWDLPFLDGHRFLKWLGEQPGKKPPAIVVTASHSPETEELALEVGALSVIFKPVGPEKLLSKIEIFLKTPEKPNAH